MSFDKNILKAFYEDAVTRDEIKRFLIAIMEEEALKAVFEGGDLTGYKAAKEIIEKAWSRFETEFSGYKVPENLPNHR